VTLIRAGNAIVRKAFNVSSNCLLEIQWYLFAAVFLLGADDMYILSFSSLVFSIIHII
jgi:TRAP-type mannitol/chloroaromatic compound transport system permease small subunit